MEDGKRDDGLIGDIFAFGGRGFSIHNANSFTTPSAIVDSIEQVTKQYYRSVFNTAYLSDSSTPQSDREATSTLLVRLEAEERALSKMFYTKIAHSFFISYSLLIRAGDRFCCCCCC